MLQCKGSPALCRALLCCRWQDLTTTLDGPEVCIFKEACKKNKVSRCESHQGLCMLLYVLTAALQLRRCHLSILAERAQHSSCCRESKVSRTATWGHMGAAPGSSHGATAEQTNVASTPEPGHRCAPRGIAYGWHTATLPPAVCLGGCCISCAGD